MLVFWKHYVLFEKMLQKKYWKSYYSSLTHLGMYRKVYKTFLQIIKTFKNSKPLESSKYKKHDQIRTKITTFQQTTMRKQTKKEERKKKATFQNQIWLCFLYFEYSSGFEFLKFLTILLFGRWEEFELVVIRVQVQVWIS